MAALTYDEAAHLLRRMGFGGTPEEVESLSMRGREGAVDFLLNYKQIDNRALEEAFIKQTLSTVSLSLIAPRMFVPRASAQANPNRKILVVIELIGGNDGFNTVIPFTDSRYYSLRPTLGFRDRDLKDAQGRSMIISDEFGLHPSLSAIKLLYDEGRVAAVLGVGYPNPNGSHFASQDIWYTAIIPNVTSFEAYGLQTDAKYPASRASHLDVFTSLYNRSFGPDSLQEAITRTGRDAIEGSARIVAIPDSYTSDVVYPAEGQLARAMKMMAQVILALPESSLLYVQWGFFDHHARQILDPKDKLSGAHAALLREFSDSVRAFYDDMAAHSLGDNVVMMQWSEFGRRPQENRSLGTDHGSASSLLVIGNPVRGGIYGEQPSLGSANLDETGNPGFTVDFRSIYATILDGWLETDSREILGQQFENIGFLS